MLAAALFASLLAQAEQAPPPAAGPAAPGPVAPAPGPAEPAPAPPAAAPTATPAPGPAAAPPPSAPSPAGGQSAEPPPANSASVHVRYAYRIDSGGDSVVPSSGLSLGGEFERRVHAFANGIEIGVATNFFYDRFAKDVIATSIDPVTGSTDMTIVTRTLSQTSFALMETTAWRYADMRLFLGLGGGLTVGYFGEASSSNTDLMPLARAVFGFDFAIAARTCAILRVDYSHTFNRDAYLLSPTGALHPMFGDLFDAGIGLLVRF